MERLSESRIAFIKTDTLEVDIMAALLPLVKIVFNRLIQFEHHRSSCSMKWIRICIAGTIPIQYITSSEVENMLIMLPWCHYMVFYRES